MKRHILIAIVALLGAFSAGAELNYTQYYSSLNGLSGAQLKTAIYNLCRSKISITGSISSNYTALNEILRTTDLLVVDGTEYWWDMYSSDLYPMTMTFSECSYQREHALPKSWWKVDGSVNYTTAYCDINHLYPSNGPANQAKNNWPLGIVEEASFDNGVTKVGIPAEGTGGGASRVFEPADQYKGDFARSYMYMVTTYQDLEWNVDECPWMVERNTYPTFTEWAVALIGDWQHADPVSQKETDRNDAVETVFGNRNPYIDLANLYDYVWGDSVGQPLNVKTTVKGSYALLVVPEPEPDPEPDPTPDDPIITPDDPGVEHVFYASTFTGGETGDCYGENGEDYGFDVWTNDANYGWKGSGYNNGAAHATEASLLTPQIGLTNALQATLTFSHCINYADASPMSVAIRHADGSVTDITEAVNWPTKKSWTFVESGEIDLADFLGEVIQIEFRYTSTDTTAGTWEIKDLMVKGLRRTQTSIAPGPEIDNSQFPVEYFSIDGRRVDVNNYRGIVIRRQGTGVTRILVR